MELLLFYYSLAAFLLLYAIHTIFPDKSRSIEIISGLAALTTAIMITLMDKI